MFKTKLTIILMIALTSLFYFNGCDEDTVDPLPVSDVESPTNVKVTLDAVLGGGGYATVTWNSSPDESSADFRGYVVITDSVNINGNGLGRFDSAFVDKSAADLYNVTDLVRGRLFKTLVYSVNTDNELSEAAQSVVYSGVYSGTGTIDEFSTSTETQSAFGFDAATGLGTQYPYSSTNGNVIDIHVREENGQLSFYSPGAVPTNPISPARVTQFALLGQGGDAYNMAVEAYDDLTEPTSSTITIADENVYLIKTQDNIYVKIWVTEISGTNFSTVEFTYKLQPVADLKILKR